MERIKTAVGDDAWLVTDHAAVRSLLGDERLGLAHPDPPTASRTGESALFGGPMGNYDTELADHARMRSLLQPHFSPKHLRALKPRIEEMTTSLLDAMSSPADLHASLALPLPISVICELLGVPYADRAEFRAWSEAAANTRDGERSLEGLTSLWAYGMRLVAAKRSAPEDDVISRLAADPSITDEEAAQLSMGLLFAGHETTVVRIGIGTTLLLKDRSQWELLCSDPSLVPRAVEEILRMRLKDGGGIHRYARTDVEIEGVTVHTGELVVLDISAANRDPQVFEDPERVDVMRSAAAHLTFGHGPRYCIGAPLARIELEIVFRQLVTRFPTMRLAVPVEELTYREDVLTGGLTALPVEW